MKRAIAVLFVGVLHFAITPPAAHADLVVVVNADGSSDECGA